MTKKVVLTFGINMRDMVMVTTTTHLWHEYKRHGDGDDNLDL